MISQPTPLLEKSRFRSFKKNLPFYSIFFFMFGFALFWVDDLFAANNAVSLSGQIDKVDKLVSGKFLKTGLTISTIVGVISSIVKGSIAMAVMVMGIGVFLSYYLGFLRSGSFIQGV